MVTIFNRKKLLVESSGQEVARVRELLGEKGIEFLTVTKRNSNILVDGNSAKMAASMGVGYSGMAGPAQYTYFIYVKRKDFDRALAVIKCEI